MTYLEKLEHWYQTERAAGRVADLKLDLEPGSDPEKTAKAVYETVTGQRKTTRMTLLDIDKF